MVLVLCYSEQAFSIDLYIFKVVHGTLAVELGEQANRIVGAHLKLVFVAIAAPGDFLLFGFALTDDPDVGDLRGDGGTNLLVEAGRAVVEFYPEHLRAGLVEHLLCVIAEDVGDQHDAG